LENVFYQTEPGGKYHEWIADQKFLNTRSMFPAVSKELDVRWCSSYAKIEVMNKAITWDPRFKNANYVICTGERRAESTNRANYLEIEPYKMGIQTDQSGVTWRPVIDFSDQEVWDLLKKHKIQPHPAYQIGWGRCSCQICIFNSPNAFATCNEIDPGKVQRIAEIEKDRNHTMFHGGDIYEMKVNKGESYIKDPNDPWVKQALGEFTKPIIVEGEWKEPLGKNNTEDCGAN
jgi:3'-phosphoadenosine 5'-phosphosulfate sulfotransferase (PAPS reductase)/FAD synthetase